MKTYTRGELEEQFDDRAEWVPAEVAHRLYESCKALAHKGVDFGFGEFDINDTHVEQARAAITAADGEPT